MVNLLSQLTHIEIHALDLEETARYYEKQIGLRIVDRTDDKVYLRAWGDYYTYSLVLSRGDEPGMVSMAWRTTSDAALREAAERIEAAGYAGRWVEPGAHIGQSYVFTGPYGHTMQLFWDVEKYKAPVPYDSQYPDRPERRSGHGLSPRHLDHVTIAASDVQGFANWYSDTLGFRRMAFAGFNVEGAEVTFFGVLTTNEKSHDLGVLLDSSDTPGRIHHYAWWLETRDELVRAADLLIENGTPIEYGPGIHGIGEQVYLYFREPSGLRIEVNTGGYRNYIPDWEPNRWSPEQGADDFYRNLSLPPSMLEAFPPAEKPTATEQGLVAGTEGAIIQAALHRPEA
ncbi:MULTISPECIES: VOC family protein [unclassified Microbacterium]|uniref:VOC family protein n=1 Tax=unclassified Microbacterium TaxID=2609290 RepID=UPI000EA9A39E|nr:MULTISPECIES: VOC family protein [unclassified Microbacterium]MBT2486519.1 VOC family protein [Microbacterium sp. ISL-108]RKN69694.1 catechol 1,2-dioxygenase [Microbacterium sp. CGR2]